MSEGRNAGAAGGPAPGARGQAGDSGDDTGLSDSVAGELIEDGADAAAAGGGAASEGDDGSADALAMAAVAATAQPLTGVDQRRAAAARRGAAPKPNQGLKAVAVPVLATVGLLLLIPGIWAVMLLAGSDVWHAGRDGADEMAKLMLVCGPMGLVLISASLYFFMQLRHERARGG